MVDTKTVLPVVVPYPLVTRKLEITKDVWDIYREEVKKIESTDGSYDISGGSGGHYDGRYQLGAKAKKDAARYLQIDDPGHEPDARKTFRDSPTLQETFFAGFTLANNRTLLTISAKYESLTPVERLPVLGYAHNQGGQGAADWLATGVVREDGFGTKADKYTNALRAALKHLTSTDHSFKQADDPLNKMSSEAQAVAAPTPPPPIPHPVADQQLLTPYQLPQLWPWLRMPVWTRPDGYAGFARPGSLQWWLPPFPRNGR